jgi:NAD(P)-dependent dehydrogenase (short-subunit alcohol dehydrogenase family)
VPTKMRRIAVVTGGGSGIRADVAQALAEDGWTVVLAGRRKEALEAVVAGGSGLTGVLDAIPTDVTDEASVRSLFETTVQRYGRVDLLFNNAGTGAPSVDIDALELEVWNKVLAVNLTGAFLCTREAFRAMRQQQTQGGRIINNGSISMLRGHVRLPIPPQNMPSPASPNLPRSTGGRSTSPADRSISATRRPTSEAEQRPELPRLTAPCDPSC